MANAIVYNFELDQGASWSRVITWRMPGTEQDPTSGDPIDLTSYTGKFVVRDPVDTTTPLITTTPTLGGEAGTITISLTSAQTASLDSEYCSYELEVQTGSTVTVLLRGQIKVRKSVD